MVTRRRLPARARHLYLVEWMEERGFSDETFAEKMKVARETVTRWRTQQHRLNPDKMAAIAKALNCQPEELWRPPSRPSLDAVVKNLKDDEVTQAADMLRIWARRA